MAEGSAEATALTVLTIAEIPNFWSGFLPSLFTISTFSGGDEQKVAHTKKWIRRGEMQALALSLILGAGASTLARTPWPFLGTVAICGYLLYQYENALAQGCGNGGLKLDMDKPEENAANVNRWR